MAKRLLFVLAALCLSSGPTNGQARTIVARQLSGWFYADGKMKPEAATFEFVFEIGESSLVRRSVRNIRTGLTEVDQTPYEIITDVSSYNAAALQFRKLSAPERKRAPVVRAIGRPGTDAVEVLFIGPDWVQSVKTVKDYMVIMRFERTQ